MKIADEQYIHATIHEFKSNISKYIRLLERGEYRAVKVYRYNEIIGMFLTVNSIQLYEQRQAEEACDDVG